MTNIRLVKNVMKVMYRKIENSNDKGETVMVGSMVRRKLLCDTGKTVRFDENNGQSLGTDIAVTNTGAIDQSSDNFERHMLEINCIDDDSISFNIGENIGFDTRCEFVKMFTDIYVRAERPDRSTVTSSIKLCLESPRPFNCHREDCVTWKRINFKSCWTSTLRAGLYDQVSRSTLRQ